MLGITAALSIQEHLTRNQAILIVAREFPGDKTPNYASPWAGAHYRPIPITSPETEKSAGQARRSFAKFKQIAANEPAAGVQRIEGVEYLQSVASHAAYGNEAVMKDTYAHVDGFRALDPTELPEGVTWGVRYDTVVINSPVYCACLLRKFVLRGGQTRAYTLVNLKEAFFMADNVKTVVNCSGVGFADPNSFIIRGICFFFLYIIQTAASY